DKGFGGPAGGEDGLKHSWAAEKVFDATSTLAKRGPAVTQRTVGNAGRQQRHVAVGEMLEVGAGDRAPIRVHGCSTVPQCCLVACRGAANHRVTWRRSAGPS